MASSDLFETLLTTSRSLLGESAARNLGAAIAHVQSTFGSLFTNSAFRSVDEYETTWQESLYEHISDFISARTPLENTSLFLAVSTFLFLLVRNMSWTSRLGNLGRFSPFTRSPTTAQGGSTKVSDSDFSYITADDLRKHQAESIAGQDHQSSSPVDYGPERDTDVLIIKNKKREYAVHFPAYSIAKGELTVGTVREGAAKKTNTPDLRRIKLLFRGKNLKDDRRTCKQEGLKDGNEILCTIAEHDASGSESEEEGEEGIDGVMEGDGEGSRRRRNRGKKTKRRNKREAYEQQATSGTSTPDQSNLGVPLSQASTRTASPKPAPSPSTPLDKLNSLHSTLNSFRADVDSFMSHPPADKGKKEFEHKRLSETILTQVLLKLDAVETEGDEDARTRRKALVKETQQVLNELDAAMKQ